MTTSKPEVFEVYRTKQGTLENVVLLADYEALQAECEKLRDILADKVVDSTKLRGMVINDGSITVGLEGGACALMAQSFGKQLFESGAENYIEVTFDSPDYPELGQITVTVKRETGKTPHQLRVAAEQECEKLRKDAERYRWLRDGNNEENSEAILIAVNFYGDEWDEMIDAAMQGDNPCQS